MQNSFFIVFECHAFIANRNFARSFLNNGFRLQKTNRAVIRWKQPPAKPFHHVSRDKKLRHSWIIPAALAGGFSIYHFERGEGPGDEVDVLMSRVKCILSYKFEAKIYIIVKF